MTIGEISSSVTMVVDDKKGTENSTQPSEASTDQENVIDSGEALSRQPSGASCYATEGEEEDEETRIQVGPKCSIKEHLEKDKDDESLRRWKEQLLGSVDVNSVGEILEPDVKILSLTILSPGRPDLVLPVPEAGNPKGLWFTLKEGIPYSLRFSIQVSNNIVCGLRYTNTVWKTGIKVDSSKHMLGTFSPQSEPYIHEMPEETAPSGFFARGSYSARSKFIDDDDKCYLEINYTFDIQKQWPK
ncbi:rho GDP-dissociation inhibitor 1-like [Cornus florida]|uniref:rho GDP-dissociation inhibitor 1-like n=1 Tax=Cornus florida TaxID=4283 RepID=UPI00289D4410|nr:rho GDP-dissociation inhibitor 1-like [Cornus florida]